jgi:glycosyltransferase involved in cell wall biosynthesis
MFSAYHFIENLGIGGAQSMMFELYHAISTYFPECSQTVFYHKDRMYDSKFVSSYGIDCKKIKNSQDIVKRIKKEKRTVIIFHKLASSNYSLLSDIKKQTKAKIVVINHTLFHTSSWKNFKKLDVMIAVSKHMDRKIGKWYPQINHTYIHNGVCGYRYKDIEAQKVDKKNIFLTGRINRICGWKHSNEWLTWCSSVKLPIPMIHEYIGSGVGGRKFNKPVIKKGRNKVKMLGGISNFKQKVSIIKNWDVFLYETNRDEGISVSVLEALACGVPVICSNHYGNKEIIKEGINGYVFKSKEQARQIMTDLINNPKKLKKLKETTQEHFLEKLDAKHMASKYIKVINDLWGEKNIIEPKERIEPEKEIKEIKVPVDNFKFTILTASYNKAKNLGDWASSILKQDYRPLEVILVDDKSTDNTNEVLKGIEKDFLNNNIEFKRFYNEKQLYCGSSYKKALENATGSYLGVLDADDMLTDGAVEYIMNLYKEHSDIAWIYTQFLWCNEQMNKKRNGFNRAPEKGKSLLDLADRGIHGVGCGWRTFSYKIKKPEKLFKDGLTCSVDKYMCYRLEEAGNGIFVDKICYQHRGHPKGSTDSVSSTKDAMTMWKTVIQKTHNRRKKYDKKTYPIIKCEI